MKRVVRESWTIPAIFLFSGIFAGAVKFLVDSAYFHSNVTCWQTYCRHEYLQGFVLTMAVFGLAVTTIYIPLFLSCIMRDLAEEALFAIPASTEAKKLPLITISKLNDKNLPLLGDGRDK